MRKLTWRRSRDASPGANRKCQSGFALTEALIAAMIAAGVAVAASQSLGVAVRTAKASNALETTVREADIIIARLDAGLGERQALQGMDGWQIAKKSYGSSLNRRARRNDVQLFLWVLSADRDPAFEVKFVRGSRVK